MMVKSWKALLVGASVLAGATTLAAPATAVSLSTGGDIQAFCEMDGITKPCGDVDEAFNGLGNVELNQASSASGPDVDDMTRAEFASEGSAFLDVDFEDADGTVVRFESLTSADWFGADNATAFGDVDLANTWFTGLLAAYETQLDAGLGAVGLTIPDETLFSLIFDGFNVQGGVTALLPGSFNGIAQRLSDPNIASAELVGDDIEFELAGFLNAGLLFDNTDPFEAVLADIFDDVAISEVVKTTVDGTSDFYYSFGPAIPSEVVGTDGISHTGLFPFRIERDGDDTPESVPEPSIVLGIMAVGGVLAASKRKANAA